MRVLMSNFAVSYVNAALLLRTQKKNDSLRYYGACDDFHVFRTPLTQFQSDRMNSNGLGNRQAPLGISAKQKKGPIGGLKFRNKMSIEVNQAIDTQADRDRCESPE